jgi:DNA end-binding protein Ku
MHARAMWKGIVRLGGIRLPVKLYAAVQDRDVHFHLLHDQDQVRLRQRMVNPQTDETVDPAQIKRGVEIEPGRFVIVTQDELATLDPPESRDIVIERCIEPHAIDIALYDRPYHLGPDGNDRAYFALAAALAQQHKVALARWVMRRKEYVGIIEPRSGYLALLTLHAPAQVTPPAAMQPPTGRAMDQRELKLAQQLVSALADDFDAEQYHDDFRNRLMEMIERKAQGQTVDTRRAVSKPGTERNLTKVLTASLDAIQGHSGGRSR